MLVDGVAPNGKTVVAQTSWSVLRGGLPRASVDRMKSGVELVDNATTDAEWSGQGRIDSVQTLYAMLRFACPNLEEL